MYTPTCRPGTPTIDAVAVDASFVLNVNVTPPTLTGGLGECIAMPAAAR